MAQKSTSFTQATINHEELIHETNTLKSNARFKFPQPPFPGNEIVVPICSPSELSHHAIRQKNCVGSYSRDISKGKVFIYQIQLNFKYS